MKLTLNWLIQLLRFVLNIFKDKECIAFSMEINTFRLCKIYRKVVYLDDKCVLIIALRDNQEQQQSLEKISKRLSN